MAIAYLGSTAWASGSTTTASSSFDSTGATLIVVVTSFWNNYPGLPTDNKGNAYTPLTQRGAAYANQRMFYCENPTVGTGHTITQPSSAASNNVSTAAGWWVIAQIQSKLDALPAGVRDDVKFHGWRDSRLTYPHRMSDLELAQARNALLVQRLQAGLSRGSLSGEEITAALADAGLAP